MPSPMLSPAALRAGGAPAVSARQRGARRSACLGPDGADQHRSLRRAAHPAGCNAWTSKVTLPAARSAVHVTSKMLATFALPAADRPTRVANSKIATRRMGAPIARGSARQAACRRSQAGCHRVDAHDAAARERKPLLTHPREGPARPPGGPC